MTCKRLEEGEMLADLGGPLDPHVEQCEDCRAQLRGYQQLRSLLAEGATTHRASAEWKQRTLARVRSSARASGDRTEPGASGSGPRLRPDSRSTRSEESAESNERRRKRVAVQIAAAVIAAAAALLVFFFVRGRGSQELPPGAALAMQIADGGGWRGEAHPGQQLQARAIPAGAPYFQIRVYRGTRDLLVQCPKAGSPACVDPDSLVWTIPYVGTYQVILLISQNPIAEPRGSLNDDVAAATAGGAKVAAMETVRVY